MDRGRHRQRHLQRPRRLQPQVEVLAQQLGGERGRPVPRNQVGRALAHPVRGQHGAVQELQERGPVGAALLGQAGHLDQRLDHHAQVQVVAQLDQPALLRRASMHHDPGHHVQIRPGPRKHIHRPGRDDARRSFGHHVRVPADRRGQEVHPGLVRHGTHPSRGRRGHRRAVHDHLRPRRPAEQRDDHLLQVPRGRHRHEHDVARTQIADPLDSPRPRGNQRRGLGRRPVPHRDPLAGLDQPPGQRRAHPPGAQPAQAANVCSHTKLLTKDTDQKVTPASTHRRRRPQPARSAARQNHQARTRSSRPAPTSTARTAQTNRKRPAPPPRTYRGARPGAAGSPPRPRPSSRPPPNRDPR